MPLVIPIFIPHEGCPHTCIFCNQNRISGKRSDVPVTQADIRETISVWLGRAGQRKTGPVQVAFYGGSFTGLAESRQKELLEAVAPYLEDGRVQSIRLSTRPDYIDEASGRFLRTYGVATVELGVQSLDDLVLAANRRGHTASHAQHAVRWLRGEGLEVGLQLMLGLPGQSFRSLMRTVGEAVAMRPDFVRIYPVLVLRESMLGEFYRKKEYTPLSLEKAVAQAARMKKIFDAAAIPVVRMGLQPGPELEESLLAGPYHPAFGELVSARIMLQKTRKALQGATVFGRCLLSISDRDVSIFRGVNSSNIKRLEELGLADRFRLVTDRDQPRFTLRTVYSDEEPNHAQRQ